MSITLGSVLTEPSATSRWHSAHGKTPYDSTVARDANRFTKG
jgi:hypothetical protein